MLSSIHLMRICNGNSTDSYFGLITYRFMSEGTVQTADQMHGWIDGSALLHHDTAPFVTNNLFGNQPPRHGCQHGFGDFIRRLLLVF